jgi:small nuclear ribonucleoprotein (snRNP)-like protein
MSQPTISRTLSKAILKPKVRIKLKIWNTYLTGKLVKFDGYMNLIVENAKEIYFGRGGKRSKDIGTVLIRGASIIFIGQDREKIMFAENEAEAEPEIESEEGSHDKLMHRKESEFS